MRVGDRRGQDEQGCERGQSVLLQGEQSPEHSSRRGRDFGVHPTAAGSRRGALSRRER